MKRLTAITLILVLSLVLAACGATTEPQAEASVGEAPAAAEMSE
jgi:PBP1b-binding outer membrane lipoprotein LpoB